MPIDSDKIAGAVTSVAQSAQSSVLIQKYGNEARVYFSLRQAGWTHKGTCGVMGNIKQESDFRTNAKSFDGHGSVGICQWTFGRKTKLKNFLKSHGYGMDSIKGQCEYLVKETKESYSNVNALLVKEVSQSVEYICDYFCDKWERPAAWAANKPNRRKWAKIYFDRYNGTSGNYTESGSSESAAWGIDFNTTTKKLSSSNNFEYIQEQKKEVSQDEIKGKSLADDFKKSLDAIKKLKFPEKEIDSESIAIKYNHYSSTPPKSSTFGGNVSGSILPIYTTLVEAPFAEVTIGGVTFGTYQQNRYNAYPNYIQSLQVHKTNGTINTYTINLIHQVSPGDNPNYISSLLSTNGFEKISIRYGDGNSGTYFREVNALLTDVKTSFEFVNNLIKYELTATSLSYLTATSKMNFSGIKSKPSKVMMDLLTEKKEIVSDYFTGMADIKKVSQLGLIPTNDKEVEIDSVQNKNIIEYLSYLTSLMIDENETYSDTSTYYLSINDENYNNLGNTFSVKEVYSGSRKINELVYEVDLGYPDDNMVFDFSVNTDYAWSTAMNTNSNITTYRYDINNTGKINKNESKPYLKSTTDDTSYIIDNNTWKQLTRFPINATLNIKGLMAPIMLLTYVKVNNYYFGSKRITSGMYIVTEQIDYISGSGCRTSLGLTRVSSDVESITVDGRVTT